MASNFLAYWLRLQRANPSMADHGARMTISVESFKAQLLKAYQAGAADQAAVVKELQEKSGGSGSVFDMSMFGDLFKFNSKH